jgi:hypothetical protein
MIVDFFGTPIATRYNASQQLLLWTEYSQKAAGNAVVA